MIGPRSAVLVIDSDVEIRKYLISELGLAGFSVLEAKNAEVGLRSAAIDSPALIILDPILPDSDGAEIIRRIRSWSSIPIVVLSEHSNEEEKIQLLELGADDYIVRPFAISELVARAHAAI